MLLADWGEMQDRLRLPATYVFKHVNSRPHLRTSFFEAVARLPLTFTVVAADKLDWSRHYLDESTGLIRIIDQVDALIEGCPGEYVEDQILVIDGHHGDHGLVRSMTQRLRQSARSRGHRSFKKISAVPDHRKDSLLIQA
ncbi:MAG TPA: hypothetical protein VFQ54_09805, partial [Thermomicrobiales bacterium]|nr:hypothetical protein [Thermomicrobiales bacterium]